MSLKKNHRFFNYESSFLDSYGCQHRACAASNIFAPANVYFCQVFLQSHESA